MSRHTLHSEENFWPCVSDMFLALFVIALVLYASATKDAGRGDLLITDQVVAETVELMTELGERLPEQRDAYTAAAEEVSTEHSNNIYNKLVKTLAALPQDEHLRAAFKQNIEPKQELNIVVDDLYKACLGTLPQSESHAGEKMRIVRRHLIAFLDKQSPGSDESETLIQELQAQLIKTDKTISELQQDVKTKEETIKRLRDQLAEAFRMTSGLQQDVKAKAETIKRLQRELETLKTKDTSAYLRDEIARLTNELEELKGELRKDTRGLIMRKVATLLDKHELRGKVEIKESEGILRIPSSSVSFASVDKSFTYNEKMITEGRDVLQHLSELFKELVEDEKYGALIESIVIEGHADPGRGRNEYKEYIANEMASSARALLVWFYMDGTFFNQKKLQYITNRNGLSLFSHSGFGARIPVKKNPGESDEAFKDRCRRIDIRFIAAPLQTQD